MSDTAEVGAGQRLPVMARAASLSTPLTGARAGNVNYLGAARSRRKFELFYPDGFQDETYLIAERSYKERAHLEWQGELGAADFRKLLARGEFRQIADIAVRIESRTNLLFSFEKMALRDAVKTPAGARLFATELYAFLWGRGSPQTKVRGLDPGGGGPAPKADPGADLADGDGVRLHRPARQAPVPQADRDAQGGAAPMASTSSTAHSRPGRCTSRC